MTETRLFTVAEAAVLIEAATGQSRFDIAKDIDRAAWTYYAKPGHGRPLEVYNDNGRRTIYRPGLYGVTIDPQVTDPLEEKRIFTEYVPYLHLKVDLIEVLDALEYHAETQAKILAERDKPAPAGGDAEGSDAVPVAEATQNKNGTVTVWTNERKEDARAMLARLKAERNRAPTAMTAAHYGVTATRLRAVLKEAKPTAEAKQQKKAGPWDALGT